jgi:putative transposase
MGWKQFVETLSYKAIWAGKNLIKVDSFASTRKTCSVCNGVKNDVKPNSLEYNCNHCNSSINKELNTAKNIRNFALIQIGQELSEYKPVDHALTGE